MNTGIDRTGNCQNTRENVFPTKAIEVEVAFRCSEEEPLGNTRSCERKNPIWIATFTVDNLGIFGRLTNVVLDKRVIRHDLL